MAPLYFTITGQAKHPPGIEFRLTFLRAVWCLAASQMVQTVREPHIFLSRPSHLTQGMASHGPGIDYVISTRDENSGAHSETRGWWGGQLRNRPSEAFILGTDDDRVIYLELSRVEYETVRTGMECIKSERCHGSDDTSQEGELWSC